MILRKGRVHVIGLICEKPLVLGREYTHPANTPPNAGRVLEKNKHGTENLNPKFAQAAPLTSQTAHHLKRAICDATTLKRFLTIAQVKIVLT